MRASFLPAFLQQFFFFWYVEISLTFLDIQLYISISSSSSRCLVKGYQDIKTTILLNMEFHISLYTSGVFEVYSKTHTMMSNFTPKMCSNYTLWILIYSTKTSQKVMWCAFPTHPPQYQACHR